MVDIEAIRNMTIQELRPLVQHALGMDQWPGNDWIAIGKILDQVGIQVFRAAAPPHVFSVVVTGKIIGEGIGSTSDVDPVLAIFKAYLIWNDYKNTDGRQKRK